MEIDLTNTWCIANVPNHDKLRLLGYDPKPIGSHKCGDYYYMFNGYEVYDSNVFNRDFKQIELNEDNEFVYVKENEDTIFAKYGFEKPDFEGEILKEYGSWLIGYVKNGTQAPIPCMWFSYDGSCNINRYKLTPIKKPWYETCKFPCLVKDESTYPVISIISASENYSTSYLDLFTPLTNEEIEGLKQ
jgi:hypothetical protein